MNYFLVGKMKIILWQNMQFILVKHVQTEMFLTYLDLLVLNTAFYVKLSAGCQKWEQMSFSHTLFVAKCS